MLDESSVTNYKFIWNSFLDKFERVPLLKNDDSQEEIKVISHEEKSQC